MGIRSDNGPEFIAWPVRESLTKLQVRPLYIEPGIPWENGYVESFTGKMQDELLNGEMFYSLIEGKQIKGRPSKEEATAWLEDLKI